jgi:hypothetical protein
MRIDEDDTQPFGHGTKRNNREYVDGEFVSGGGPGGSPLVSGGYEQSKTNGPIASRGLNRKDQRYVQPEATIIANRQARAVSEISAAVITQGATGLCELRTVSGNNYDTNDTGTQCDCPDFWRLRESGYTVAVCKHCYMVQAAILAVGGVSNLPWSTAKLAEVIGISERTAQELCRDGKVTATKVHNVWVIGYNPSVQAEIDAYMAKLVQPNNPPPIPP